MAIAQSKLTKQGQISVPAEVRKRLGLAPGSVLSWEEKDGEVIVRRARKYTSEDIHRYLFPNGPPKKRLGKKEIEEGIAKYMREKHARD